MHEELARWLLSMCLRTIFLKQRQGMQQDTHFYSVVHLT